MSNSIEDARAAVLQERERIQSEIRELEAKLVELDSAVVSLERLLGTDGSGGGSNGRRRGAGNVARQGRIQPSMVSLIEAFIESQGRKAAHASEVLDYLHSIDRAPGGKNPKATVQTTLGQLQKRGRITNLGGNRWRVTRAGRSSAASDDATEEMPEAAEA